MENERIIIVSDGSYHPTYNVGTAVVIIESENGTSIAHGYCWTHGAPQDVNAYRSELMGILLGMTCLSEFTKTTARFPIHSDYACDNTTAVDKCFWSTEFHQAKL